VTSENKPSKAGVVRRIARSERPPCGRQRALGLNAEMPSGLLKRDFELPAQHEPGEDLLGCGVQVGAEQGLGGEGALGVADQDPAQRDRRHAAVVPDGGV
jgi:hypothetical protein